MKRRLYMILLSGVFSFGFAETSGPCDMFRVGQYYLLMPSVIGNWFHLPGLPT